MFNAFHILLYILPVTFHFLTQKLTLRLLLSLLMHPSLQPPINTPRCFQIILHRASQLILLKCYSVEEFLEDGRIGSIRNPSAHLDSNCTGRI